MSVETARRKRAAKFLLPLMRTLEETRQATPLATSAKSTTPSRVHFGQGGEVNSILHLQRKIGNQAVRRLVEAKPQATPQATSAKSTTPSRTHFGQGGEVNSILHLQRTIESMGNTKPLEGVLRSRAESSLGVTLSDVRVTAARRPTVFSPRAGSRPWR